MKVLLKQNVETLGRMGEVVEVANGYARNFLIPRGIAVGVTRGRLKEIEEQQRVLEVRAARERESMESVSETIQGKPIIIKARCSATGKLFGSVTNRQLAEKIEEVTGTEIDRHKLILPERVRTVGRHRMRIKLHPDVAFDLEFEVEGEGFVAEEPEPEEGEVENGAGETAVAVEEAAAAEVEEAAGLEAEGGPGETRGEAGAGETEPPEYGEGSVPEPPRE